MTTRQSRLPGSLLLWQGWYHMRHQRRCPERVAKRSLVSCLLISGSSAGDLITLYKALLTSESRSTG